MNKTFNKANAFRCMLRIASDHRDAFTGEVNHTALVEDCASTFGVSYLGGCLDADRHWIWALLLRVV